MFKHRLWQDATLWHFAMVFCDIANLYSFMGILISTFVFNALIHNSKLAQCWHPVLHHPPGRFQAFPKGTVMATENTTKKTLKPILERVADAQTILNKAERRDARMFARAEAAKVHHSAYLSRARRNGVDTGIDTDKNSRTHADNLIDKADSARVTAINAETSLNKAQAKLARIVETSKRAAETKEETRARKAAEKAQTARELAEYRVWKASQVAA
jgi:hypothetical protein